MSKPIPRPEDFYRDYGDGPAPTIANLDAVVIVDNQEPLVSIRRFSAFKLPKGMDLLVRQGVSERLERAAQYISHGGGALKIAKAWQPRYRDGGLHRATRQIIRIAKREWPDEVVREAAHRFCPDPKTFYPVSVTTGGAFYVFFDPAGMNLLQDTLGLIPFLDAPKAQTGGDPLTYAMELAGFVRDPSDRGTWCYGTSAWALAKGEPCAIYGRIEKAAK